MACEAKRGCGFRKAGGLYLVGDLDGAIPVDFLPACIDYPFSRSTTWAEPSRLLASIPGVPELAALREKPRMLLMWVGREHYTPASFMDEAGRLGVSKRVSSIPEDARPGDPIALAHPSVVGTWRGDDDVLRSDHVLRTTEMPKIHCGRCEHVPTATALANMMSGAGSELAYFHRALGQLKAALHRTGRPAITSKYRALPTANPADVAGVFTLFRLRAVELVLPASVAADEEIRRRCDERGVRIVAVPDNDPDHVVAGWKLPSWLRDDEPTLPGVLDAAPTSDSDEAE